MHIFVVICNVSCKTLHCGRLTKEVNSLQCLIGYFSELMAASAEGNLPRVCILLPINISILLQLERWQNTENVNIYMYSFHKKCIHFQAIPVIFSQCNHYICWYISIHILFHNDALSAWTLVLIQYHFDQDILFKHSSESMCFIMNMLIMS